MTVERRISDVPIEFKPAWHSDVFALEPLAVENDIPIFSVADRYVSNYERIAGDHLRSLSENGTNPWMPEVLWTDMEQTTIRLIEQYARLGDSILDVGVGLGRTLAHFPNLRRFGMDISLGYLAVSRGNGIDVCYARIEDMPYKPETFDLVICTDVLEHVLDLHFCCTKILSVLKPNGILVVRVPVRENLRPYLDPSLPYEYVHLRTFDEFSLRLLFGRVFECECLETTPAGYWPAADRLRFPIPLSQKVSSALCVLAKMRVCRPLCAHLVQGLYNPIDLNIVVRKTVKP